MYIDSNVSKPAGVVSGELLVNQELGVSGKPDFVVKSKDGKYYIPIEIKSGNIEGNDPYPGDKMQLAAYIALTTARFGSVAHGEIHYRNKQFVIQNTSGLMDELKEVVSKMRNYNNSGEMPNALVYSGISPVMAEGRFVRLKTKELDIRTGSDDISTGFI